jgi:O-antigen ligase
LPLSSRHDAGVIPLGRSTDAAAESTSTLRTHAFSLSLVFIFVIPWEGVEIPGFGAVARYVGFAAAALWWVHVLQRGHFRLPKAFHLTVFAFVVWNALSVLWSGNPSETLDRAMTWAQLLVFVVMLWDLYTTRSALNAGLQAYVLGAYVAIGSALANYFSGSAFYTNYNRFSAGDTNPDGFGFILAMGMPVAWYLASSKSTTRFGRLLRMLNFAYIPAAFLGISLSGTRSALIATLPAMAFGMTSLLRLKVAARIAVFVLLASSLLFVVRQVQDLSSFRRFGTTTSELTEGDLNNRTKNWREGLESFTKRPVLGVGGNMYRSVNSLGKVAHNSYLSVLVEVGMIGFILFGAILTIVGMQALRLAGWDRRFWITQLMVWTLGAFTLTWEHRKSTWLFFSLVVAFAALPREREDAVTATANQANGIP